MNEQHAERVEALSKRFGRLLAVDQLSFQLEAGTITGFLGPNGAGKTTTADLARDVLVPLPWTGP
jgi:ABC-2 type transport system ATP-binding protein